MWRLQLAWPKLLTHPFTGVFLRLHLGGPRLFVPLLLGAPKGLPKVDFRVCESAKLSAMLNFGCAKVLNPQRFSKKRAYGLSFGPPASVSLEFWGTRCAFYTLFTALGLFWGQPPQILPKLKPSIWYFAADPPDPADPPDLETFSAARSQGTVRTLSG